MMPKSGLAGLMAFLLGGAGAFSAVQAQAPDSSLTLELIQRVEQLEREVRHIRGELEVYRHQVELLQRERSAPGHPASPTAPATPLEPPVIEQAGNIESPAAVPPVTGEPITTVQPVPETPVGVEQADLDAALREFGDGRYSRAISDLRQFLQTYTASSLASEAQYWLGESYYAVKDYDAAKESFINLGLRYPNSARLPDALLKLGYVYELQGDIGRAREVLQKLLQVYPETQAAGLARQRLQLLR